MAIDLRDYVSEPGLSSTADRINQAIRDCSAQNEGTVDVKATGTYQIGVPIQLQSHVTLQGFDALRTVFQMAPGANLSVIVSAGGGARDAHVGLIGLGIDGHREQNPDLDQVMGVWFANVETGVMRHCRVVNTNRSGLTIGYSGYPAPTDIAVQECWFDDCGHTDSPMDCNGVSVIRGQRVHLLDNRFRDAAGAAIDCEKNKDAGDAIEDVRILGNRIVSTSGKFSGFGILVLGQPGSPCQRVTVAGNDAWGDRQRTRVPVLFEHVHGATVGPNRMSRCQGAAYAFIGCRDIHGAGNVASEFSLAPGSNEAAIAIAADCVNVDVR